MLTIDCWMAGKRSKAGDLVPDRKRFPSGMHGLGQLIHSMGMKFGIYESAGYTTCQGLPGSLGPLPPLNTLYVLWLMNQVMKNRMPSYSLHGVHHPSYPYPAALFFPAAHVLH